MQRQEDEKIPQPHRDLLDALEQLEPPSEDDELKTHLDHQQVRFDENKKKNKHPLDGLSLDRPLYEQFAKLCLMSWDDECRAQGARRGTWSQTSRAEASRQTTALEARYQEKLYLMTALEMVITKNNKDWTQKMDTLEKDFKEREGERKAMEELWNDKLSCMEEQIQQLEERNRELQILADMTDKQKAKMNKKEKACKTEEKTKTEM